MPKQGIRNIVLLQGNTMSELEELINIRIKTRVTMGQRCKAVQTHVTFYTVDTNVFEVWSAQLTF